MTVALITLPVEQQCSPPPYGPRLRPAEQQAANACAATQRAHQARADDVVAARLAGDPAAITRALEALVEQGRALGVAQAAYQEAHAATGQALLEAYRAETERLTAADDVITLTSWLIFARARLEFYADLPDVRAWLEATDSVAEEFYRQ